jgi:hypothetical protein
MKERLRIRDRRPGTFGALVASAGTIILACLASGVSRPALAGNDTTDTPAFAPGMIAHMQAMRQFSDPAHSVQMAPRVIPPLEIDSDASRAVATFQPGLGPSRSTALSFRTSAPTEGPTLRRPPAFSVKASSYE